MCLKFPLIFSQMCEFHSRPLTHAPSIDRGNKIYYFSIESGSRHLTLRQIRTKSHRSHRRCHCRIKIGGESQSNTHFCLHFPFPCNSSSIDSRNTFLSLINFGTCLLPFFHIFLLLFVVNKIKSTRETPHIHCQKKKKNEEYLFTESNQLNKRRRISSSKQKNRTQSTRMKLKCNSNTTGIFTNKKRRRKKQPDAIFIYILMFRLAAAHFSINS